MGNERRCILCRTVYSTKLEMQEHMRSMLHHRELENLKGRNCDHKCWVCKVSVMGLAGYAKHISSTLHKQLVEQQAQNPNSSESEDDYFDSDLVYLVTQRDDQIRKEEEEAARRQKEDDLQKQMQWANGKEFHHSLKFSQFPKRYKVYQWQRPMCPSTSGASRGGQTHKDRAQRSSSSTGQSQQNWTTVDWGQNSQGANNCDFREYLPRRTFWKSKNNRRPRCRYSAEMDGNIDFRSDVDLPLSCSFSPQQEMYDMSYPQLFKGYKARGQKNQWGQGRGKHGWTKESRYLYSNLTYPVSSDLLPKDSSIGGSIQENDKPPSSHPASIWDQSHFSSATHCSPMFSTTGNVSSHKDYNSTGDRDWRLHQMMWKVETTLRTLPGASSSQGLTSKIAVDTSQTECNSGGQRGENFKKSLNEADRRGKVVAGVGFQAKQSLQSVQVSTSTSENPKNNVPPTSESMEKAAVREPTQEMSTDEPLDKQLDEDQDQGPSTEKCPVSDSDVVREDSETSHNPAMPNLHKLALPTLLKRDLTRHIGKAATHEPNLNIARRIRNVTKTRKGDSEKDSGLKPTLRQLISSGSRRSVNWDQVYQEVCKKKQEKGKGLPRFGIEMVTQPPSDPEGLSQEEEDFCLSEGFQWETFDLGNPSVVGPLSRKRSLSEGSICTSRAPSDISQFPNATTVTEGANETPQKICKLSLETQRTPEHDGLGLMETSEQLEAQAVNVEDANSADLRERERLCITLDSVEKSSSAAEEAAPPGISRQVRIKRERSHVDQLLSVSLREDELNTSLQTLDNNLNHARTALQAAYMEVQRLMVMKEQVTAEMTVLRSRRIRILQEMQEGYKSSPSSTKPNQEASRNTAASATLAVAQILDPFDVAGPEPVSTLSPAHAAEVPILPCLIKEEPLSPSHENPNLAGNQDACISLPMMAPPADHLVGSPKGGNQEKRKSVGQSHNLNISPPVTKICLVPEVLKDKGKDFLENCRQVISEPHEQLSSRGVNLPKASSRETVQPSLSQSGLTTPLSKQKTLKKQKKKKKMPHKVQQSRPETHNVDEQELNVQATVAYVTTSTQAPPPREMQEDTWDTVQSELKQAGDESDSSSACMEIGELPKPPLSEILSVDTDSETEKYAPSPKLCSTVVHAQNLACNEVTSTSELESKGQKENNASTSPVTFKRELKECKEESGLKEEEDNTVPTEGTFAGHTGAITAMQIHGGLLYTSSEDQTVRAFNLVTRECVALYEGHGAKVNCLFVSTIPTLPHRLYTGSSDHTVRCYRLKNTECEEEFCLLDRVLCLHSRWKVLYAGLANGCVVSFNLKTNRQMDVFECHGPRAVSCLASTQEGVRQILLVGSYDHTISVRDAKNGLLLRTLKGHNKTVICMTVVNDLVFSGSSDMSVHANNIHTGELNRIYKGHQHAVTTVAILGKVMVTACLDKLVRVYELQSHDRLQVYGGHKDMVMCMTIHKSMIYTGCYDGSLQAVKLNLMQNYRCWWHGCSLIFGVMDHLWQHLTTDHTSPRFETIKCRWKDCDAFFTTWKASVEDVSCHLKKHAEKDSQP